MCPYRTITILCLSAVAASCLEKKVDFSAEIKPILNKKCISCHGGVKKNGGFSVLFREEALDTAESGKLAIVPHRPDQSELIRRITSSDPEIRMPYKEEPLTAGEIELLQRWIEQGAEWGDHWAYKKPQAVRVPGKKQLLSSIDGSDEWARNDIDHFVLDRLEPVGLQPSPDADPATLVRRLYLDIIGIPPSRQQALAFINNYSEEQYAKTVDELLGSPQYGEKWASWWLDLARYSDTKGYERDVTRTIWRYRDWVIRSLNEDKPFDQFTTEQLAGDLLANPTDEQLVATAFHRNTMNNDEGGTEDEEFRVAAVIDRVNTTYEVWQSTTMACVQCHSHPYDPIRHDEYYRSLAYFNNTRDEDTEGEHPNLRTYEPADEERVNELVEWVRNFDPQRASEIRHFLRTLEPKYHPHDFDRFINGELIDTKWLGIRPGGSARLPNIDLTGMRELVIHYWKDKPEGSFEVRVDDLQGESVAHVFPPKTVGRKTLRIPIGSHDGVHDLYFVFSDGRSLNDQAAVAPIEWLAFTREFPGRRDRGQDRMSTTLTQLLNATVSNTPVTIENTGLQRRKTHVFERGNWLVKGDVVTPAVPGALSLPGISLPANRLEFARWLVSSDNPLTARSLVNRLWEQIFGRGIVETLEDFGTQGAAPTHPELLDWLALRMMEEHRWSMKALLKDIVMSSTYRQSSHVTAEHLARDPSNQFLARAPRIRLSAEQVRDQALFVGGLLSSKMYGKSVMPYQPEGIWQSVWNGEYWKQSEGEDQHRRSVYTFIKRTSPYPSMMIFDGSSREVCLSRRIRTNTPLQALVTMNDPVYVEAARELAGVMMRAGSTTDERIRDGYFRLTFRNASVATVSTLRNLYNEGVSYYSKNPGEAVAASSRENTTAEDAAMILVATALLNLDEVVTRE